MTHVSAHDSRNFIEKLMIKKVKAPIGDFRNWAAITSWAQALC
ncbi:MAG: hypothetical protein ACM3X3_02290 [Betaproteobacteria bacterium]